jgi:hypothetical protein
MSRNSAKAHRRGGIPTAALVALRKRLAALPGRDPLRREAVEQAAQLFGVSRATIYRSLKTLHQPKDLRRADRGQPRTVVAPDMTRYCEIVAALKIRTENGKGRKLSTGRAIEIIEQHGVGTPDGHVQAPPGLLKRPNVDPYPWREIAYASELDARRRIATILARPLGVLPGADLSFIAALVGHTLGKAEIRAAIRERFQPSPKGAPPC